ncbi:alpha-ketoglutarate-dependent dioxygenase alkB homolog 7, mitochondrial isoform X1 [Betta splendens]|uniref:Alpha-ketoglutarate-dependent dioxygenase alkB homolog 7, mitochondrial isoform X1 n=1 Tax=Betta splendens TaxID=158456 RepID=A0A6P7N7D6_BETSP|nr:alpha-ketoglutarate-dependent dioxygenase alkB homolog 7, mitochondrial isoform X1 [Betta splendens]
MKALLTVIKRIHRAAVCTRRQLRSSSCARRSGPCPSPEPHGALVTGSSWELVQRLRTQVEVRPAFITEEEETALLRELEPGLRKKRYEFDHWDDAIHGYRETERVTWAPACEEILDRVRAAAFPADSPLLGPVHVLDLDKAGYIKPHVDSVKVGWTHVLRRTVNICLTIGNLDVRCPVACGSLSSVLIPQFCGSTIAGLCLLSDSIMRLVKEDCSKEWLDLLLPRRSLYVLRDEARYKFTHEILKDEESVFKGQKVPRQRRVSVICRNLPA